MTRPIQILPASEYPNLLTKINENATINQVSPQRVIPVDASWYLPTIPRNGLSEFLKSRIPNSVFFDVGGVKDAQSPYPHMLPSVKEFNVAMSKLGIKESDVIVVYDRMGNFSAPRVAWTFLTLGHQEVYLLDNFLEYVKLGLPIDDSELSLEDVLKDVGSDYRNNLELLDSKSVLSFDRFYEIVKNENQREKYNILDARSKGRYLGKDPEPRPGLSSGHAPGVKSLSFDNVLNSKTKRFYDPTKMKHLMVDEHAMDLNKPTIVMCGTGVSACILKTALDIAGFDLKGIQVYDGSWTEYAQRAEDSMIIKEVC
ncbi:hypothetical protein WICPIJ_008192 [Wickerhamomyces pijperi]|uniref:Rhodanese domain-containing protein n=1 Tax=Wickerhamomyces pijperi TaxID=599730 RepID=A0A9P8PYE6_WICPI|nr:hypothetical protein WICPIJ_008192 [Wickerhamomyces pijperi]